MNIEEYSLATLTVGDVMDSRKEGVPESDIGFYLLGKTIMKNGVHLTDEEFRSLPFGVASELMGKLDLGNGKPNP
jgi:hypothetical protein